MYLWLVLYVAGHIIITVGPLPADEAACKAQAAEMVATIDPDWVEEQGTTTGDVRAECEWSTTRPEPEEPME